MTARPVGVAVVGAGPRGTAVLERLTANLGPSGPWADTPAEVHIVEPRTPGAGRVWDPGQPEQLLMNTVAGHATAFPDDTVRMAGPATTGPTLMEWARDHAPGAAPGLQPWEHPRRALMGRYLAWAHERITRSAAPYIRIVAHPTRAIGLDEAPEGGCGCGSTTGPRWSSTRWSSPPATPTSGRPPVRANSPPPHAGTD